MENELTNYSQERLNRMLKNRHLADSIRKKLANGWPENSTFLRILGDLSDEQLVAKYLVHTDQKNKPIAQLVREPVISAITC